MKLLLPILGYSWALRAGKSHGHIVFASALGGMLAGLLFAVPLAGAGNG